MKEKYVIEREEGNKQILERVLEEVSAAARVDAERFAASDLSYTEQVLDLNDRAARDEESEAGVAAVHETYTNVRKSFTERWVSMFRKRAAYLASGMGALSLAISVAKKEFPDFLETPDDSVEVAWNVETKSEVQELAREYARLLRKRLSVKKLQDVSEDFLVERFVRFVEQYGPDISVIHPESRKDDIADVLLHRIQFSPIRKNPVEAHYDGKTMCYPKDSVAGKRLDYFINELAHHVNGDYHWMRGVAYAEDMVQNNFRQDETYKDPYTNEYQAHKVTVRAMKAYLLAVDGNFNVPFAQVFNVFQTYYRACASGRPWERLNPQTEELLSASLGSLNFSSISENQRTVCKNIERMRDAVEYACVGESGAIKAQVFEALVDYATVDDGNILKSPGADFLAEAGGIARTLLASRRE
jgi:hypothetical protein